MLHAHTPGFRPELLERLHQSGGGKWNAIGAHAPERIVPVRLRGIRRIQVHDALVVGGRQRAVQAFDQIAMGVDDRVPAPSIVILPGELLDEGGLADPRLPYDVEVREAVMLAYAERGASGPKVGSTQIQWFVERHTLIVLRLHAGR